MWPTIDFARRRLSGRGTSAPVEGSDAAPAPRRVEDIVIVLGTVEVDQLRAALELVLGDALNGVERVTARAVREADRTGVFSR